MLSLLDIGHVTLSTYTEITARPLKIAHEPHHYRFR